MKDTKRENNAKVIEVATAEKKKIKSCKIGSKKIKS